MPAEELAQSIRAALEGSSAGLVAAFLFGSHAAGREHRESDVDVGVLLDRAVFASARARFERALELSARRGERFEDYTETIRNLGRDSRFDPALVRRLERLQGFRNVVVHAYLALDLQRAVEALDDLEPTSSPARRRSPMRTIFPSSRASPIRHGTLRRQPRYRSSTPRGKEHGAASCSSRKTRTPIATGPISDIRPSLTVRTCCTNNRQSPTASP